MTLSDSTNLTVDAYNPSRAEIVIGKSRLASSGPTSTLTSAATIPTWRPKTDPTLVFDLTGVSTTTWSPPGRSTSTRSSRSTSRLLERVPEHRQRRGHGLHQARRALQADRRRAGGLQEAGPGPSEHLVGAVPQPGRHRAERRLLAAGAGPRGGDLETIFGGGSSSPSRRSP